MSIILIFHTSSNLTDKPSVKDYTPAELQIRLIEYRDIIVTSYDPNETPKIPTNGASGNGDLTYIYSKPWF